MKLHKLSALMLTMLPASSLFAAALDRTGQSISAFLQSGNYAEASVMAIQPSVSGKDMNGISTGDMANTATPFGAAIKIQPLDNLSLGLIFDQPFDANAKYKGDNAFVAKSSDGILPGLPVVTGQSVIANGQLAAYGLNAGISGNTQVDVKTNSITGLVGFKPVKNLTVYGGPVYQEVKADIKLRGSTFSAFNGYDASIPSSNAWGWLAGAAYEIPEIALKASATYRSKIQYDVNVREAMPLATALAANSTNLNQLLNGLVMTGKLPAASATAIGSTMMSVASAASATGKTKFSTPQSVNLDFQTGIMADTIAFANLRWVNWKDFVVAPTQFAQLSKALGPLVGKPNGFNLVDYSKDQWSANLGVGRKLTQTISGSASVGWDNGAGNPVTLLGPTNGYWNVGLGVKYSPSPVVDLSAGIKYFWLGNAKAETGAHSYAGNFTNNDAIAVGLKLGYHF